MDNNVITWVANNIYCVATIVLVVFGGLIVLAIDCWQKWH